MKIVCMSDIHCCWEKFKVSTLPDADCAIVAGDLTNNGRRSPMETVAAISWLQSLSSKYEQVFWIPGNHDIGYTAYAPTVGRENVHNMLHKGFVTEQGEYVITGISLTVCFDLPVLAQHWDHMTANPSVDAAEWKTVPADIVISHGPPFGVLDETAPVFDGEKWESRHLGSPGLRGYIEQNSPLLVVCGHIHEAMGTEWFGSTYVVNTAQKVTVVDMDWVEEEAKKRKMCPDCGQSRTSLAAGEYPCPECNVPTLHDLPDPFEVPI